MERIATDHNFGFRICPVLDFSGRVNGFLFGKNSKPSWGKSESLIGSDLQKKNSPIHAGSQDCAVTNVVTSLKCSIVHNICNLLKAEANANSVTFPKKPFSEFLIVI